MHVTLVYVDVIPEMVEAFIEATQGNHLNSIKEPGNRRFDVLRDRPVATVCTLTAGEADVLLDDLQAVTRNYWEKITPG